MQASWTSRDRTNAKKRHHTWHQKATPSECPFELPFNTFKQSYPSNVGLEVQVMTAMVAGWITGLPYSYVPSWDVGVNTQMDVAAHFPPTQMDTVVQKDAAQSCSLVTTWILPHRATVW